MTMNMAVCPDGVTRAYTVEGEFAVVQVRCHRIEGKITEDDGVTKFRQSVDNHLMYYPARDD